MYLVSAYAITGTANNTAVGGPPVVIGSDTSGVVHVPHSYASITPSVLHIKLEQQTDRSQLVTNETVAGHVMLLARNATVLLL